MTDKKITDLPVVASVQGVDVFPMVSIADGLTHKATITQVAALIQSIVGGGTVSSVSVVSANGFAGTVATATTTPAITLTTTLTGLLKGNGTAMSVATAGTDYVTGASTNTFTNKTYDTAGTGNSFSINGVAATANTGTGAVVRATSPSVTNLTVTGGFSAAGGGSITQVSILGLNNQGTGTFDFRIQHNGTLTAQRTLTYNLRDADRTIDLSGNITTAGAFVTSGANSLTLTTTASTNVTLPASGTLGYLNIPQNSQSAAYTTVLADSGKHLYHPSADTTARTFTIDSNANVAYPIGTAITFVNDTSAGVVTIAITSDTLVLSPGGTTGSRTLAANGMATAIKTTSTRWMISGSGLT